MRFIADENIPNSLIEAIRRKGYSVKDLKEEKLFGVSDQEILEMGKKEKRMTITFDKDFMDLSKSAVKDHKGIILLRYKDKSAKKVVESFMYLLDSPIKEKFEDSFCEVFDGFVKIHKG